MSLFAIGVCILPVLNLCDSIAPKVISRSRAQKAWWWHGCFKGRSTSPACALASCKQTAKLLDRLRAVPTTILRGLMKGRIPWRAKKCQKLFYVEVVCRLALGRFFIAVPQDSLFVISQAMLHSNRRTDDKIYWKILTT